MIPAKTWAENALVHESVVRVIQADVLRSVADEMEKDAREFEGSDDLMKTGQFFALSRTADHYRARADAIEYGKGQAEGTT